MIIQFYFSGASINGLKIHVKNIYLFSNSAVHASYYVVQQIDVKLLVEIQKFGGLFSKSRHSDWETDRRNSHCHKSQKAEIYNTHN